MPDYEFCLIKIKIYKKIVSTFLARQDRKPLTGLRNFCERFIVVDSGGVKETKIELQMHYNNYTIIMRNTRIITMI